jgi:MoaA/NifB/PqqE/SkfB family radical SAM enzyme
MTLAPPTHIIWDITYTCPLRCTHCYSESGRRPSRQLAHDDILRVADRIISLRPAGVGLAGGEALVVKGIFEVVERLMDAGIEVYLYTSGWPLRASMIRDIMRLRPRVHVSVDGATAAVHDRIRGRAGAFDRAMDALRLLDDAARESRLAGGAPLEFGIDATIVRSSFPQLDAFCTDLAPRFPEMRFVSLSAVVPSGLASRDGYARYELLTDEQADALASRDLMEHLRSQAPASIDVSTSDNRAMRMHPDLVAAGKVFRACAIEPDGQVRAMCIYEGAVGNILTDDPAVLWERAVARWSDPVVVETLATVCTMDEWAAAARRLDAHFGTAEDRVRIDRRPVFVDLAQI